jgi:hypothetical protein
MKTLKWKGMAMVALALCLGSMSMNGHGGAWAAGNPSLHVDEWGSVGILLNGNGNPFTTRPETLPNLLALVIVGVSLLGAALLPDPYREKREKTPEGKTETFANCREKRNSPRHGKTRLTGINKTLSATTPLSPC